jgi:hypothetical protein
MPDEVVRPAGAAASRRLDAVTVQLGRDLVVAEAGAAQVADPVDDGVGKLAAGDGARRQSSSP